MSGGGLVVCIVMLVIGVAWLAMPYLRDAKTAHVLDGEKARERLTLAAGYERALVTVRDLDEDFQVGKLSAETYAAERERWLKIGAAQLEALEQAGGTPKESKQAQTQPMTERTRSAEIDDSVEQAIAAYIRARDKAPHN